LIVAVFPDIRSGIVFEAMAAPSQILHQIGVIAYRVLDGKVQVLLMTSRDTGRWIIPKGNVNGRSTPSKAAEKEAYEEAGVRGTIASSIPLGIYTYFKKLELGRRGRRQSKFISFGSRNGSRSGRKKVNGNCPG
jgi:8-oxo-dGTP pyrophosphatase MutT (NUDIX family)